MKNRIVSISLAIVLAISVGLISCGGEGVPEIQEYNLTISTTEGGEVTTPGEGTFSYDEGTAVILVVFPHTGYRFVNWTGDVDTIDDVNAASTNITMNADYVLTANFKAIPEVIHLIFSDHLPSINPVPRALTAYANYIADHSNGKVEIEKVGYGGEILPQLEVFEGVQVGIADCASYVPNLGDSIQYLQVMKMPFMGWGNAENARQIYWKLLDDYPEILGQFPSTLTFATLGMMPPVQLHYYAEDFLADTPDDIAGLEII